jgi:hypothetical protein
MAMVDIQSLFADIIESPRQRQQAMSAQGAQEAAAVTNNLTGGARLAAPLLAQLAMSAGKREEGLKQSVGGLFGIDTRTPSQQLQQTLQGADTTSAAGLERVANDVEKLGYGVQAATIRQQAAARQAEMEKLAQATEVKLKIVTDSTLPPEKQDMLTRVIQADPNVDPMDIVTAIQNMGAEVTDPNAALKARVAMLYEPGTPEYNAAVARGGVSSTEMSPDQRLESLENLARLINTSTGLKPEDKAMLYAAARIDPTISPMELIRTITSLSGQDGKADPLEAIKTRASLIYEPGSEDWNKFVAYNGQVPAEQGGFSPAIKAQIANTQPQFEALGLSPEEAYVEAANIATGVTTSQVLDDGTVVRTNIITGEVDEFQPKGSGAPVPVPPTGLSFYELADVAVGPISGLSSLAARTPGVGPLLEAAGLNDSTATEARAVIKNSVRPYIRALSLSDRYAVAEQQRIIDSLDLATSAFDTADSFRARLRGLDSVLAIEYNRAARDVEDNAIPRNLRQQARTDLRNIEYLRSLIGVPQSGAAASGGLTPAEQQRINQLLRGNN